jgi:hypothetical protein
MNANEYHPVDAPEHESAMIPHVDVAAFLESWDGVAATLIDRHLTVSGSSHLAEAMFPNLRVGVNLAREVFLDVIPGRETSCAAEMSPQVVAALHASLALHARDAEFEKIVGELSARSRDFSTAWAAERQQLRPRGILHSMHPVLGAMTIRYQLLELAAGGDTVLIVWQVSDPEVESALNDMADAR